MRALFILAGLFLGLLFSLPTCPAMAEESGQLTFCETLSDNFEPGNPGTEFKGPNVSWIASSPEPFGKPHIVMSLYRNKGGVQSLLDRREILVNPAWNNVGIRNMAFPEEGDYSIGLTLPDGQQIASGNVRIVSADAEVAPLPEEKVGGTLETLYNKYLPKSRQNSENQQ